MAVGEDLSNPEEHNDSEKTWLLELGDLDPRLARMSRFLIFNKDQVRVGEVWGYKLTDFEGALQAGDTIVPDFPYNPNQN